MMETANRRTLAVWIIVLILTMITGCWPADRSHRDTQAPTVPDYVTAQAVSPTQVNLTWWAAQDNVAVTGYYIYSSGRQIGSTASTQYDLSGLAPDTAYRFSVAAYDQAGNVSPTSAPVSVRTPIAEDDGDPDTPPGSHGGYTCTQVIGFSQTAGWYQGGFMTAADDAVWQLVAQGGAGVDLWKDPYYSGWSLAPSYPCSNRSDNPDRVIFTISGPHGDDVDAWATDITSVVGNLRSRYPGAAIVLQPVVGGPEHGDCSTRASDQHPFIDQAIALVASQNTDVIAGMSPEVTHCNQFSDGLGHLTDAGYDDVGRRIAQWYAGENHPPVPEDDYVAYWPFDEGAGATTANLGLKTYSTTLQNNASWTDGISGKALQLDGIDDYATITDSNAIPFDIGHLTQGTISVWFKVDTLPGADEIHPILYMGDGVGGSGHSCIIIELGHFNGGTQLYFTVLDDNKRISMCFNSRQHLETGTWHHFAGVVGSDYNTGYLNGLELTDRNYNGGTSATRQFFADVADKRVFWFGRGLLSSIQTGQYLDGAIDEIKIYNRPLTEVEIQDYYHYMTLETSPPEIEPGDDAQAGSDVCGIYLLSSRAMTDGGLTLVGDRDEDFVAGFAARIGWEDIEPEAGVFDFSVLTDLLPRLEANGQRLTLQILGAEPAHVVADAQSTWTWVDPNPRHTGDCADEDGCRRPLPWDPAVLARQRELFSALADTQIPYNGGSVALAQHPLLDQVMLPLVGWGRIRELGFQVEDWPGYTRDKLVQATTDNILMHYEYFPSISHQIQLFTVRDTDNSKELWEALLEDIVAKIQAGGLPMPTLLVENLAHRVDETGDSVFGPNPTGQGRGLIAGKALGTWTGLQMLAPWSKPFPGTENSLAGGNPVDAMLWADETYGARYFELYSADVDAALAGNQMWLEGLQALGNSLCAP